MFCLEIESVSAKSIYRLNLICVAELLELSDSEKLALHTGDENDLRKVFQSKLENVPNPSL